jgi:hypothetical protein
MSVESGTGARVRVRTPRTVPLWALRGLPVLVAGVAFAIAPPVYAAIAVALALLGALLPASCGTWFAAGVIALAQLAHPAIAADPRPYLMVAVVHLLHVLGGLAIALPAAGTLQRSALILPARRWLVIQVVAQPVLAAALLVQQADLRSLLPAGLVVVVTAAAVVGVVVLLRVLAARR